MSGFTLQTQTHMRMLILIEGVSPLETAEPFISQKLVDRLMFLRAPEKAGIPVQETPLFQKSGSGNIRMIHPTPHKS